MKVDFPPFPYGQSIFAVIVTILGRALYCASAQQDMWAAK